MVELNGISGGYEGGRELQITPGHTGPAVSHRSAFTHWRGCTRGLDLSRNAQTLLQGLGLPDCRMHSPNESFPIEDFEAQTLLKVLAWPNDDISVLFGNVPHGLTSFAVGCPTTA